MLQSVMFAVQNGKGQTRELYKDGVGKEASTLRRRIMIQALFHAQRDTFNVFSGKDTVTTAQRGKNASEKSELKTKVVAKIESPGFPSWLRGGDKTAYILTHDIDEARKYHEEVNGNKLSRRMTKIGRGDTPTREDDARYAMIKLYSTASDIMQGTRRSFPSEFFE